MTPDPAAASAPGLSAGARLFFVCLASAAGGGARYLLSLWTLSRFGAGFPVGTVAVNALGSFFMGAIAQLALQAPGFDPDLRLVLTTGLLGGFTTYSAFNQETLLLLARGHARLAALNLGVTVGLCLVAGWLGLVAARAFAGPVPPPAPG